jgi:glycosyltransferase involved in cell wall biosynthesis
MAIRPRPTIVQRLIMPDSVVRTVGLVGTYPPRRCGIATFTRDLHDSMALHLSPNGVVVVAVDDLPSSDSYPPEVAVRLPADARRSYREAARILNDSGIDAVYLQHEFGIFGGDDGAYVMDLIDSLDVPVVTTLHTVRDSPTEGQRDVMNMLLASSSQVVVMNPSSISCLQRNHGVTASRVNLVPHGVPSWPLGDPGDSKSYLGLRERRLLLTFGLLSRDKGIEVVLDALPKVVDKHPDLLYVIVGATHPSILRWEGEAYRQSLENRIDRLGIGSHVAFENRFVDLPVLWRYLSATDIYVSPHRNPEQDVSGTLAFALSAGNAVVATPYPSARQLITTELGRLFPFDDSAALTDVLIDLLNDSCLTSRMRQMAYERTRTMIWPVVGRCYLELTERAVRVR